MRHLGDITKINGAEAPVVDCIIGGSPCQDISIAGKRAGLAGERSGLYMEQIRIIKEMRANDRANGRADEFIRPRYMVWENVPGAFSSNGGKDFATVLEEAVRVVEPEAPPVPVPEKGWPTAGVVMGDGWSVAWRVLDAQFWGVPQRRRRIALVADFGGQSAPEILFVRKGVSGHTESSGAKGQGFTPGTEKGIDGASYAVRIRGGDGGGKGALVQTEKSGTLGCNNDQTIFCLQRNGVDRADTAGCNGKGWKEDVSYTLNTIDRHAICLNDQGGNIMSVSDGVSATLRAQEHGHQPLVMAFDTIQITSPVNGSVPEYGKPCHTINANAHVPTVVLDISHRDDVIREYRGTVPSLCARAGTGGNNVPLVYGIGNGQTNQGVTEGMVGTLNAMHDQQAILVTAGQYGQYKQGCGTLRATGGDLGGGSENLVVKKRVRRLTPLECERLQGFPDGWTEGGSDSKRYKALGNSIALPPWKWVLKRLCALYERDATMASLFDGIGGFPLIWEQFNGKGSCLWASEIEAFPMAVAKLRFNSMLDEEPAFDTVLARHRARWRRTGRIFDDLIEVQCSECEETHLFDAMQLETAARYCPYCGAEMDGGADDEIN